MPAPELVLRFSGPAQVSVLYEGEDSGPCAFTNPVTDKDRTDIRWYVETYGAHSLADRDDREARRIKARLPELGKALFEAAFAGHRPAQRLFDRFQDAEGEHRVLTIDSESAAVLALPWELLHDPQGVFLFREDPHISVRRRITGAMGGRKPFKLEAKPALHLLFVISRPEDAGFIDPRADPSAVMDALEKDAPGRVTWEVLRPATLDALTDRLKDATRPPVDILHFDGHGVFSQVSEHDADQHPERFGRAIQSELQRERLARGQDDAKTPVGLGFLLFETPAGGSHLISAQDLAENLYRKRVGLVVLSACQTAALDAAGDPMASVAGRLTATGIPAVLAMTHSVLAATTRALFGAFYKALAQGLGLASALDEARAWLANHPGKFQVRRGNGFQTLELDDWFLPALFHAGADAPLLIGGALAAAGGEARAPLDNLRPPHEAGFFGRRHELWAIERWFAGPTRRISVVGFGGQGKTELAQEAGRWLLRTGLFVRAVFVDYSQAGAADALGLAVATLGAVLGSTVADAREAGEVLRTAPTLVILDNLETLAPDGLAALLDAARDWSAQGGTRVLLTSRNPDFNHPHYRVEGTFIHRRIVLDGLGSAADPEDALDWFAALSRLPGADPDLEVPPPNRDELIDLFDQVAFHPLSIAVLAQQLRTRTARQLGGRLDALLAEQAVSGIALPGTPPSLIASLRLSLDRLTADQRAAVGRLGVFQGGAFESHLLAITGFGGGGGERERLEGLLTALEGGDPRALLRLMGLDLPEGAELPPELLAQIPDPAALQSAAQEARTQLAALPAAPAGAAQWPELRRQLESAGLIAAEGVPGVGPAYLRFHPTLAPLLWAGLDPAERERLTLAHRRRYYALAGYLYREDSKTPHQARAIARRELPNLLYAVDQALAAGDEDAVDFVNSVNRFLGYFGRTHESAGLIRQAEQAGGAVGSDAWYLAQSSRGEQLLGAGQVAQAAECFQAILGTLGDEPSFRLATTLVSLGRCYKVGGRPDLAEAQYRRGIEVTGFLGEGDEIKRKRGLLHTDLGDVLTDQGRYREAREHYLIGLDLLKKLDDLRSQGVVEGQLGTLALQEGDLAEAVRRYQEALALFQRLREPASEAVVQHQLGMAFQEARQWEQAEHHYRESAVLRERLGDLAGAAGTWNNLAALCKSSGRHQAAETWYQKAIEGGKATGDTLGVARGLSNLANLLQDQPDCLPEARRLAKESLAILETLDPGAAEIWKIYNILAQIADRQSSPAEAAEYRRLARDAKRRFAGTAHELKGHLPLILMTVQALADPDLHGPLGEALDRMAANGWTNLVAAIRRLLAGERDADALCGPLDFEDSMIVEAILQALADPDTLKPLLADAGSAA